jgi:hypothetical protein
LSYLWSKILSTIHPEFKISSDMNLEKDGFLFWMEFHNNNCSLYACRVHILGHDEENWEEKQWYKILMWKWLNFYQIFVVVSKKLINFYHLMKATFSISQCLKIHSKLSKLKNVSVCAKFCNYNVYNIRYSNYFNFNIEMESKHAQTGYDSSF